ncbi:MAG: glutaminyl-peptide cyclotransferase [Desulfococcaceae bacterium]
MLTGPGWRGTRGVLLGLLLAAVAAGCGDADAETPIRRWVPRVAAEHPHDARAWTQGLVFEGGVFYESTGIYGRSSLRRVAPETGGVLNIHRLADEFYGEGLALVGDRLIQVTWKNGAGFVYRRSNFELERTFTYDGEGWGLAWNGERLILSDGTPELRFLDPETFEVTGRLTVLREGEPLRGLNELEWVRGELYANVWPTDWVAIIDPGSGRVTGEFDLSGLRARLDSEGSGDSVVSPPDVANGIAYDAEGDRLFVTGKFWPKVFEVRLEAVDSEQVGSTALWPKVTSWQRANHEKNNRSKSPTAPPNF